MNNARTRRRVLPLAVPLVLAAVALTVDPGATGTVSGSGSGSAAILDRSAALQVDGIGLELVDQSFTLRPGARLRLEYRLTGDLERVAELVPPPDPATTTTTTTSTTTTTTTTTTTGVASTAVDGTPTSDGEPAPSPAPTTAPAPTTTVPPPPLLTVNIANFEPITRPDDPSLDRILGQGARAGAFIGNVDGVQLADVRDMVEVHDDGTATLTVEVPTDIDEDDQSGPDSLEFPEPGIYPLRVQLLVDDDLAATHGTVVERLPGPNDFRRDAEPITLAVVANVDRPTGDGSRTDDQLERVLDLAATVESPIFAAVPPPVLDAAVADDTVRFERALENDELAALTDVELDVSSAAGADQGELFAAALRAGEDALSKTLPTTFSGRDVWLASEPLSGDGAQQLRDLGFRYIVMTPELYADTVGDDRPATDRFVEIGLPDGAAMPVMIIDELGAELTAEATAATLASATPTEWAVRTITDLVLDHRRSGRNVQRSRILTSPDLGAPDPTLLVALEQLAETTPDVRFLAASTLPAVTDTQGTPSGVTRVFPDAAGPSLVERISAIESARLELASAASMLVDGQDRLATWNAALDELVTTGISDAAADTVIDGLRTAARELRTAVELPAPFTFTMTGRSDEITLRLGNSSDEELGVIVRLQSSKLTFPANDRVVRLRPNDSTDVQIPVRARSNGTSPVMVTVLTPLGEQLGEPVTLTSRVNAFTGLAQVLTAAFVLVLLTWWFSNWRSRRRSAARATADDGGPIDAAQ